MAVHSAEEIRAYAELRRREVLLKRHRPPSAVTWPQTDDALWAYVWETWGVAIPRQRICAAHAAPFRAFADAYFARNSMHVWEASRGLGGKSYLLALLGLSIACTRGGDVNILGGSGEQSRRVHEYMVKAWDQPPAPRHLLRSDPIKTVTRLATGNTIQALLASSASVRGPHVNTLLLDECFPADTRISTPWGSRPISTLVPGDQILSVDEQGCIIPSMVLAMKCTGEKQTIRLHFDHGVMLETTPNHPILTTHGWKHAGQITTGDTCITVQELCNQAVRSLPQQDWSLSQLSQSAARCCSTSMWRLRHQTSQSHATAVHALPKSLQRGAPSTVSRLWQRAWLESWAETLPCLSLQAESGPGLALSRLRNATQATYTALQSLPSQADVEYTSCRQVKCGQGYCAPQRTEIKSRSGMPRIARSLECGLSRASTIRAMDRGFYAHSSQSRDRGPRRLLAQPSEQHHPRRTKTNSTRSQRLYGGIPQDPRAAPLVARTLSSVRVVAVEPGRRLPVYNLTVEPTHNYLANGFVVHNCDEMALPIFDAAMGQTMALGGRPAVTVMSCFTPDTLVTMADGTVKPIALIALDDQVLGPGGRPQMVTAIHQTRYDGMMFECRPKGLPAFFVTPSHMFPTPTGEEPIRQAAAEGLISPTWHMAGMQTSSMAGWLVGLYLAEGHLRYPTAVVQPTGRAVRSYEVTYSLHRHEAPVVAEIIEKWADQRYPTKKRPIRGRIYEDRRGLSSSLRVTSRGLHGLIMRHVRGRSCETKELTHLPDDRFFAEGLLRGWLAGDGTNYPIETSIQFGQPVRARGSTVSRNLAWQLACVAGNLGWNVSVQQYGQRGMGLLDVWSLNIRSFFDMRSNQAFRYRGNRKIPYTGIVRPAELTPLRYAGNVYDLTVEPDHHYVAGGILAHNSTHHYPDGTFSEILRRVGAKGWAHACWCYHESLQPHGWLAPDIVAQKRYETTAMMFATEYDLQEPSPTSRAILPEAVRALFDRQLGEYHGRPQEYIEAEAPVADARYAHGADWARSVDWCVDQETEILTKRGWLRYDQLLAGQDYALARNPETGCASWQLIESVFIRQCHRDMIRMEGASHSSLTTPDHRWLLSDGRWKTTETLRTHDRIPTAAPCIDLPSDPIFSDTFVEIMAWYWTEGWDSSGGAGISQSIQRHPLNVARIRSVLTRAYGPPGLCTSWVGRRKDPELIQEAVRRWEKGEAALQIEKSLPVGRKSIPRWARMLQGPMGPLWSEYQRADGVITWRLSAIIRRELRKYAPGKIVSLDFLLALTREQLQLFIDTSIDGDGVRGHQGQVTWVQSHETRVRRFEMACLLAGFAIRTRERVVPQSVNGQVKPHRVFETSLLHTNGFWPVAAARHPQARFSITRERYDGVIWCPSLTHQNWLARRNGTVYYTGNTEIITLRTDVTPVRLVAYERLQRLPWPQMVARFEARQRHYGLTQSRAAHDGTGLGDVIDGYLSQEADNVVLVGRTRSDLFANFINAIEHGELVSPYIEALYHQFLYCSIDDLYGAQHPPDGFVAGAMAWHAQRFRPQRWAPVGE